MLSSGQFNWVEVPPGGIAPIGFVSVSGQNPIAFGSGETVEVLGSHVEEVDAPEWGVELTLTPDQCRLLIDEP